MGLTGHLVHVRFKLLQVKDGHMDGLFILIPMEGSRGISTGDSIFVIHTVFSQKIGLFQGGVRVISHIITFQTFQSKKLGQLSGEVHGKL